MKLHAALGSVVEPAQPTGVSGQVTCIGDSWAQFACDTLAAVVKSHNKSNAVVNKGVGGSTAAFWAKNTGLVRHARMARIGLTGSNTMNLC